MGCSIETESVNVPERYYQEEYNNEKPRDRFDFTFQSVNDEKDIPGEKKAEDEAKRAGLKYEDGNGNTYKMSSQYSNNYVNEVTGEAVQSNDPSYNPGGNYTAVAPSDYSAASAPASYTTATESGE